MASTQTETLAEALPGMLESTWRTILADLHTPKVFVWELAVRVGALDALVHHGGEIAVEYAYAWLGRGDVEVITAAESPFPKDAPGTFAFHFVRKTLLGSLSEWESAINDPEEDTSMGFDFNGGLLPDAALRAAADLLNAYRDGLTYGLPVRRSKLALDMGRVWALLYLVDTRVELLLDWSLALNPWHLYVKLADWLRLRVQAIAVERGDEPEMPVGDRTLNAAIAAAEKAEYMPELDPDAPPEPAEETLAESLDAVIAAENARAEAEEAERKKAMREVFAQNYGEADFKIDLAWIQKYMGGAPARESTSGLRSAVARVVEQLNPRERELFEKMCEKHEASFPEMARFRRAAAERARAQEDLAVKAFRTGFVLGRELGRTEPSE